MKTRSVFSELARTPSGGRSRCGYADVLSPTPLNERAPSNGGFFVMGLLLVSRGGFVRVS